MRDSLPVKLALPELRYMIGSEPSQNDSINKFSSYAYIKTVKNILREVEFNRIRETFLGPLIKLSERNLKLSAKIAHVFSPKASRQGREGPRQETERFEWDFLQGPHTKVSASDTTFPLDYVKIAHDIDVLMTYPWGRIAYELLLKSLKNVVDNNLDKNKYELHGFPLAFHLWILVSVPLLSPFCTVIPVLDVQPSTPIYLLV
ncbi:unnamed protein product [Brassica oleracea]